MLILSTKKYTTVRFLFALWLTLLAFERWTVFNTPLSGLDGSWSIAIHLAHQLNLTHGTEFVFTYGPLSWLVTRLPIAISAWPLVLVDIVYLSSLFAVFWVAVSSKLTWLRAALLLFVVAMERQTAGMETPFVFYYFVLFFLFFHKRSGKAIFLFWAVGLSILTFYLKANVGLVSVISVLIYTLWQAFRAPHYRPICLTGLLFLVTLLPLSAYLLPVDLYAFINVNWHLISSFNDIMYALEDKRALVAGGSILALTGMLAAIFLVKSWKENRLKEFWFHDASLILLVTLQLFILFKQSFFRADVGHTGLFFKHGLLPFSLLIFFSGAPLLRRLAAVPIIITALIAPMVVPYHWDAGVLYRWIPQLVSYCQDSIHPARPPMTPLPVPWPQQWLTQIGNKRVDIMPDNVALLYNSQLHYAPRPVIQTYQVTDGYLDSLNASYFLSSRAPEYVLFTMNSVDNRDPFGDETLTKFALLRSYQVRESTDEWLLLQRRSSPLRLTRVSTVTTTELINKTISIIAKPDIVQLWQISGTYTTAGSVARFLFQPPHLDINLTYQNGQHKTFRSSLPALKAGLLLPHHPANVKDFEVYMNSYGNLQPAARVSQLHLTTNFNRLSGLKPLITVTRTSYKLQSN